MSRGNGLSEPAVSVVVPSEQYKARYSFVAPGSDENYNTFLQIVVPQGGLSSLRLDGEAMQSLSLGVITGSNPTMITGKNIFLIAQTTNTT
jgi:hypothetical protein